MSSTRRSLFLGLALLAGGSFGLPIGAQSFSQDYMVTTAEAERKSAV